MPIEVVYNPVAAFGQAAYAGSRGAAAEEMRVRNAQLAQRDNELNFRAELAMLENSMRQRQMDQQAYLAQGEMGLRYDQLGAGVAQDQQRNALAEAELAQRGEGQQLDFQKSIMGDMAAAVRQQKTQDFQMALSDQKALRQGFRTMTQPQQQQAIAQWEERFQMPWSGPEQVLAQQEADQVEAQRQQWAGMLQAPDGSGETIFPEAAVDIIMQMEPDKALGVIGKGLAEWRQRKALEVKAGAEGVKQEAAVANIENDNLLNQQKFAHEQAMNQLKLEAEEKANKLKAQKMRFDAAMKAWTTKVTAMDASPGEPPDIDDFLNDDQESDSAPDWYKKLKPGDSYKHPDGTTRIKR